MKYIALLIALALAVVSSQTTYSQGFEFKVLASKGNIEVKTPRSEAKKIKTGDNINSDDIIKIPKSSYVGLMHKSGKTIEIKEEGEYKAKDLAEKLSSHKTSFSKRFAQYVADEIAGGESVMKGSNYRENMQSTGSVERGISDEFDPNKVKIKLNTPRKFTAIQPVLTLYWNKIPGVTKYTFKLTDRFDRPVFSKEVSDTLYVLDLAPLDVEKDVYYFWKITSIAGVGAESETACFLYPSYEKMASKRDSIELLKRELEDDSSPLNQLIMASYFEENQLILEAMDSYQNAIKLAPEVEEFRQVYDKFLKRYGLSGR
jgi:hypothetical protein